MNVYLNRNLALMSIIHIDVFSSNYSEPINPKIKATLPLASTLSDFVSNIAECIFVLQSCEQSNSLLTRC